MIGAILFAAAAPTPVTAEGAGIMATLLSGLGTFGLILSIICIATGLLFVLGGTLGVLRLPDFFTRLHAAGITDTLGAELILLGLIIQEGFTLLSLKFLFVSIILLLTSPAATHAVANAAYQAGLKPLLGKYRAPSPSEIDGSDTGETH